MNNLKYRNKEWCPYSQGIEIDRRLMCGEIITMNENILKL